MIRVCGIDPGMHGGLSLTDNYKVIQAEIMPEHTEELIEILRNWDPTHVYLEKAQSMPGNRAQAMLNYGTGYGIIIGVIRTLKIPLTLVRPNEWTKLMHRGADAGSAKYKSQQIALNLFPHMNFIATERSKKPHDGLIDACLIAEYGRRSVLGQLQ